MLEELRRDLAPGDLLAHALLTLAEIDYWRKGESAAVVLAEEALRRAREGLVRGRCQAAIAMYAGTVSLTKAQPRRVLRSSCSRRSPRRAGSVAGALGARVRVDLFLGEGFDAAAAKRAHSLEGEAPPAAVDSRVIFKLGQWLRYVDDLDGARARLAESEQAARDEGDDSSLANILLNRVVVETWAGRWGHAAELTGQMSDAFEQLGVEPEGIDPWRAYVDAHAGRLDTVRAAAGQRPREPIIAMIWSRCRRWPSWPPASWNPPTVTSRRRWPSSTWWTSASRRSGASMGTRSRQPSPSATLDRAERIVIRFEERAARSRIPWSLAVSARCRGLLLAAQGDLDAAAEALQRALVEHERSPVPFERARTLLVQGQVLRRLKKKREARTALEESLAVLRNLGAEAWVARAEGELRRVAVRRAPDDLSATELRIAHLAATGLTNRAIAAEVFVAQKTVEANLARAYRKLGIRSRAPARPGTGLARGLILGARRIAFASVGSPHRDRSRGG